MLGVVNLAAVPGLTGNSTDTVTFLADTLSATAALDGLTYQGLPDFNGTDTLQIVVNDLGNNGDGVPLIATQNINIFVLPVNDPPVIDLDDNNSSGATGRNYQTDYPAASGFQSIVDTDAVLTDIDSLILSSITVEITNLLDGALESLSATVGATGITVDTTVTGKLVLNGPATIAEFETVLRTVEYENSSTTPDPATRNITFVVNDGIDDSILATSFVSILPDTVDPIVFSNAGITVNEGSTSVVDAASLSYADLQPVGSITYAVTTPPINGHLAFSTTPAIAISNFTQADINAGALVYVHSGSETLSLSLIHI